MDDEFSEARTVVAFVRQLLKLDARVHVTFGQPLDIAGNPVDAQLRSLDPHGRPIDRAGYVTDRNGAVVEDAQRDHLYTERLARKLCEAYQRDFVVQSTHLAAWAAWEALRAHHPGLDVYRLVRLAADQKEVPRVEVEALIAHALDQLGGHPRTGPATPGRILDEAVSLFANFHRVRALEISGPQRNQVRLAGELTLYYRNRLDGFRLSRVGA
jgi:glycerol-3-phosphate O-acyltransferase